MVTKKNIKINKCYDSFTKRLYDDISRKKKRGKKKISMDDFEILSFKEYEKIINVNYNVKQLKKMCKAYKLKISGCKNELQHRIYNYLKYSYYGQKIQKIFRGSIVRRLDNLKGPAYLNRKCINETDFLMFEDVKSINNEQFYSFKDKDNFVYGFNICSIYNLLFIENFKLSCIIPVSAVISPTKQKTFDLLFFNLLEKATPVAIGITPPTIAEE